MARFALRVKSKNGQKIVESLSAQSTILDLKNELSAATKICVGRLHVLCGFPPKPFDMSNNSETLAASGITSGDTLIVEDRGGPVDSECSAGKAASGIVEQKKEEGGEQGLDMNNLQASSSFDKPKYHIVENKQIESPGILMKQVVPADNSCLFTSIGFVLNGRIDTSVGTSMRQIIAETVSRDTITYSEAILGKPNAEYCEWIQKPDSWGGAIELAVLSHHYGIEMAVVDTLNAIINRFGEDQRYAHRVFLLFDGIHYDPLYLEPIQGGNIQTIFPTDNQQLLLEAEQLAREAKSSRQYTDVNKFTLRCLICDQLMKGPVEAQNHARNTGHKNYGEVQ